MNRIIALFLLLAFNATAAHKYVRPASAGAANGTSWTDAWSIANLNANWASIAAGDTIWIAGGSYSTRIDVAKSGTAGNYIYIKRPVSTDAVPTAAAGWSAAFDDRVTINASSPLMCWGDSYIYVDGRMDMGMRFISPNGAGDTPASANMSGSTGCVLTNLDLVGPSCISATDGASIGNNLVNLDGDNSGVNVGYGGGGSATQLKITHCRLRGHANELWVTGGSSFITVEHSALYDNGAANAATYHGNIAIMSGCNGFIFRYNSVSNYQAEGLYPWSGNSGTWYVYGNVFTTGPAASYDRFFEARDYYGPVIHGPMHVYNNTIYDIYYGLVQGDSTAAWHSGGIGRNNIFWSLGSGFAVSYPLPTMSHNFSDTSIAGTGSIGNGSNPFVAPGSGNFNIIATVSATLPRNKGTTIANVVYNGETLRFDVDGNGNTRGADGTWDMGAFEYIDPSTDPPVITGTAGSGTVGTAFNYQISATGSPTGWGCTNLPSGLSVSVTTGLITGTPTTEQTKTVGLFATNQYGFDHETATFTIGPAAPVFWRSVSSLDYWFNPTNTTRDLTVIVSNSGPAGTQLVGYATNATSPWTLVGTVNYALSNTSTKTITVRYSPVSVGSNSGTFAFSSGETNTVQGLAYPVSATTNWVAVNSFVSPTMYKSNAANLVNATVETSYPAAGMMVFGWNASQAGQARFQGLVYHVTNGANNSLHFNVNNHPGFPGAPDTNCWDIIELTEGIRNVHQRGNGTFQAPQYTNQSYTLTQGINTIILGGREAGAWIREVYVIPLFDVDSTPPAISNLSHGSPTLDSATVTYNTSETCTNFWVTRSLSSNLSSGTSATNTIDGTSTTILLTNLTHSTTYYYAAYAVDGSGNRGQSTTNSFTTATPASITLLPLGTVGRIRQ